MQKLKTEGKGFIIVTSTDNNPKVLPENDYGYWAEKRRRHGEFIEGLVDSYFGTKHSEHLTNIPEKDHRRGYLLLMRENGVLQLFSIGIYTFVDMTGRLGTYSFQVEGDECILRETYEVIKKDPLMIREFVKQVFDWKNFKYSKNEGPTISIDQLDSREVELVDRMQRCSVLDASTGYGWLKKARISLTGYNPDVVEVRVSR